MKKYLVFCIIVALCLTDVPSHTSLPFHEAGVVEASGNKQFNKAGKIYASRSQKAKVVATVKKGQTVTLLETVGSWSKVRYGKKTGWTANRDLSAVKQRVKVSRLAPSVFFEKVKSNPLFVEAKKLNRDEPISYKYQLGTGDKLHIFLHDDGRMSISNWFIDAYKPGVTPKMRDVLMEKHYESLNLTGELLYGAGTQEAIDYATVMKEHVVKLEKEIQADWHKRMRIYKQGTFQVNGDTFEYYMLGPSIEVVFE
ncbi:MULTISPECIES: SH3 domain-containing protein [Exiguobacterium]|uniref:SH3 domain-containing protein n=1 Tax=Exiguobacterium TaxID=33986 RepID=UPI001BE69067|nr:MULTISPECIES: SH3 domain-containing protein [Exiguobacterium]MCT4781641.1 SH3 domain-containing protein [Exiguobacterium himgiriensis]